MAQDKWYYVEKMTVRGEIKVAPPGNKYYKNLESAVAKAKSLNSKSGGQKHKVMYYIPREHNPISLVSGNSEGGWQAAHAFRQLADGRVQILTNPGGRVPTKLVKKSRVNPGDYSGWKNRATWNIMLWLDNDEGMHRAYKSYVAREQAKGLKITGARAKIIAHNVIGSTTPDGIKLSTKGIDWKAIAEGMSE